MKRRYLVVGLVVITVVWTAALALVAKNALDRLAIRPWGNPMADGVPVPLAGDTRVGQTFVAPMAGLYHIEVSLMPPASDTARPVILHLTAGPAAPADLYTAEFTTAEIDPQGPMGFDFEPIRDSEGREFFFYLESPGTPSNEAARVYYSPNSTLEGAIAIVDGEPVAGDLTFHTMYSLRTRERIGLLLSRMAEGRPYLIGSKAFYVILAIAYVLALGAFLYLLGARVADEPEQEA
jgi:hypothetical protein